jgi:GTP:adenosylcobinamide-phosphate guanylyltransferase
MVIIVIIINSIMVNYINKIIKVLISFNSQFIVVIVDFKIHNPCHCTTIINYFRHHL